MGDRRIAIVIAIGVIFFSTPRVYGGDVGISRPVAAKELYFVDAHSQVDEDVSDLELIIQRMDAAGVYRTILAARSGRDAGRTLAGRDLQ